MFDGIVRVKVADMSRYHAEQGYMVYVVTASKEEWVRPWLRIGLRLKS